MTDLIANATAPQLITDRTVMRAHSVADFDDSANMWADEKIVRHITGVPSTEAQSWSRILRYIGHWQALSYGYWVVEDKETGRFLGEVGFADFKRNIKPSLIGVPEIGWVLTPHVHGRGLATEAVTAALKWGDNNLQSKKTYCIFDPEYSASIRVAEKTGYENKQVVNYNNQPALLMEREAAE